MYNIGPMRVAVVALAVCLLAGCAWPFGREYEYEEQLYLNVDGSAQLVVDSSVAALVALRGLTLPTTISAPFDSLALRRLYEAMGCQVLRVGQPWYRHRRRFVEIRLSTPDVTKLGDCKPMAWSLYRLTRTPTSLDYQQTVGAPSGGTVEAGWTGSELVAFRLHLPSKVLFHNVRLLRDNTTGDVERGNILTWEQRLADRRAGVPVDMQVRMEPQSILFRTLWLFGGSFVAAVIVLAGLIWWTVRKGKKRYGNVKFNVQNSQ
jgi:hypothetical protein